MYTGMVGSGALIGVFGLFLIGLDFMVPMGASFFGLPMLVVGIAMFGVGFISKEKPEIVPERGYKFCWYCMKQIPEHAAECPMCGLKQVWD
jgi:hypothetical protein